MDEMIRYIFRNLRSYELSVKMIQSKMNSAIGLSLITSVAFLTILHLNRLEQNKKMAELEKEIKELNGVEGA